VSDSAFGPDAAAVTMNDSLCGIESNAGARKFVLAVESLEGSE
jgi:hypothetical protein